VFLTITTQQLNTSNWELLIYSLIAAIFGVSLFTIVYQKILRYPKIVRNIRRIKKKIRKGKSPKSTQSKERSQISNNLLNRKIKDLKQDISKENKNKENILLGIIFIIIFTSSIVIFNSSWIDSNYNNDDCILSSSNGNNWLINSDFNNSEGWSIEFGLFGDNNDVNGSFQNNQGNFYVLGENYSKEITSPFNDGTWVASNNSIFLPPDSSEINESGCFASTKYDERSPPDGDQSRAYFSIHIKKNISLKNDMSDYEISSAFLKVNYNASVREVEGEGVSQYTVGDFYTFYVMVSNLNGDSPILVARNRTTFSGHGDYTENTKTLKTVAEDDLIDAIEAALEKDPGHDNFTITLGIDIYSEDNEQTDVEYWDSLVYNYFNLSFSYRRRINKLTSIRISQITDEISGDNIQINQANLKIKYRTDSLWPSDLSPFSEMRVLINDNPFIETINLDNITTDFQEIEFDVKNLIPINENITLAIELFLANTFSNNESISFSIDDVYLLISYSAIEPGPDLLPLVIGLTIGLVGLVVGIGAYQLYFKYPPTVRKIRKLRKKIKKNKSSKTITLNSYNEKINNIYHDKTESLKTSQSESTIIQKDSIK
jgi:hypothetical protein